MERTRKQSILDTKQVMTLVMFSSDNACNATFIKRPNSMCVFPNYAKDLDYASAIYKGLHTTSLSVAVTFPRKVNRRRGNVDVPPSPPGVINNDWSPDLH